MRDLSDLRRIIQPFCQLTVVQTAILVAMKFVGMLRVNWDLIESPNIRNPHTAIPAYINKQKPKLHNSGNKSGFYMKQCRSVCHCAL